jgi:hypothetical protein
MTRRSILGAVLGAPVVALPSTLKSAEGLKIEEGKDYLIFFDPSAVDVASLEYLPPGLPVTFIALLPTRGRTVHDCVAAFELKSDAPTP